MSSVGRDVPRGHWLREGLIGLGTGVLYGGTAVVVGQPFDCIKTKMQAQTGYESGGMLRAFSQTVKTEGVKGLYRGVLPPLLGSGIYRSVQFGVYESIFTHLQDSNWGRVTIPYTGGIESRVVVGGLAASLVRAVIETPLEYVKVCRQVGRPWNFRSIYTGFTLTYVRLSGALTIFFMLVDTCQRHVPAVASQPLIGPFLVAGASSTLGWIAVWPLECLKSNVQAGVGNFRQSLSRILSLPGGPLGLYRGLLPGVVRSFLANGTSFAVMTAAQKAASVLGLRGDRRDPPA